MKRLLNETEKLEVRKQQTGSDGVLRCFISGEIIDDQCSIEYDHIHPFSKDGETSVSNMRIVIKELNRRKSAETLYDVRDNLKLEKLFEERKNNIRLQDIFDLKEIKKAPTAASVRRSNNNRGG
jgi:CRISPR/Cas system Type II protein with McrA/HNH and RuvC-like nuclease domain